MITVSSRGLSALRAHVSVTRYSRRYSESPQTKRIQLDDPQQYTCTLDGQTLYMPQALAEALGWRKGQPLDDVKLSLHGWAPHYFAITPADSDSERLARATIESSRNPFIQDILKDLKDK